MEGVDGRREAGSGWRIQRDAQYGAWTEKYEACAAFNFWLAFFILRLFS